jgi:lysophospholipase L1-like esterase
VSILIGVNDVWRQFDSPLRTEEHVYIEEYRANMRKMLDMLKDAGIGCVLMTPYYMEPNAEEPFRKTLDTYGACIKELGAEYGLVVVDLQAAFDRCLQHYSAQSITWDRIHPDPTGHMIIAREFLRSIGFEF